jgi:hypothetical protein
VGAAAFLEEYPVEAAPDLTTVLFANPTGRGAGEAPPATRVQATAPRTAPTTRPDVVDIGMYPGANDTERAINAYRSTVQGADKLSYDDVFELACQQKNTGRFVNLSAQRHGAAARG